MQSPAAAKRQKVLAACAFCGDAEEDTARVSSFAVACAHCIDAFHLRCLTAGCTGHVQDLSESDFQALMTHEGHWRQPRCADCSGKTFHHCVVCRKESDYLLATPGPVPGRDPADPFNKGPATEEERGVYEGGKCGSCRAELRCIRCGQIEDDVLSLNRRCFVYGHNYCTACAADVPEWFHGMCCLSCYVPGQFPGYRDKEAALVSRAVGFSTGLPQVLASIVHDYLPEQEEKQWDGRTRAVYHESPPLYAPVSPPYSPMSPIYI
jgi:hypothetical protein